MSLITSSTQYPGLSVAERVKPLSAASSASSKTKVAVSDSLSNLTSALADLKANIKNISSIAVTGTLSFTGEQLKQYGDVIAKISGNQTITATTVDLASLSAVLKNKNVKNIEISDTSANIQAHMGSLIANNSKITTVSRSDAVVMTLTDKNYSLALATGGVLTKLTGGNADLTATGGQLKVSGVAVSRASARINDTRVKDVTISDSLSNIVDAAKNLTMDITAITGVNVSSHVTKTMTAAAYGAFKGNTALIAAIGAGDHPNALANAFVLTGATLADSLTTPGTYGADANVKSISVTDTTGNEALASAMSSKVTRVNFTTSKANFELHSDGIAALGSKLGSVKVTDADTVTLAASSIRSKAAISALAKTTGQSGSPVGVGVIDASLSDMHSLIANKQVNKADIRDTVKNMLEFSSDGFATLSNLTNVTITIADNASNVSANAVALINAVEQYQHQQQTLELAVEDTAANLGNNIHGLQTVATAITGANADATRIHINQTDDSALIKVDFSQYTTDHQILAYAAADTGNAKNVEIASGSNSTVVGVDGANDIDHAKQISFQLQAQAALLARGTAPTASQGSGSKSPAAASLAADKLTMYKDIKQIDLTLVGSAGVTKYGLIATDDNLIAATLTSTGLTLRVSILA